MANLFTTPVEHLLGPTRYEALLGQESCFLVEGGRSAKLRAKVRASCPRLPGVYGMYNATNELIYVGKAKSLRVRLLSYFRKRGRDRKAGRILGRTRTIVWQPTSSEFAALLRELELIQRWRPHYNVQGVPGRRRPAYICVGRPPARFVYLSRKPTSASGTVFGPISSSLRAREAIRRLNEFFQLRDCPESQPMHFPETGELFQLDRRPGCLRFELGTCLGPCVGATTRASYAAKVGAARAFLNGTSQAPIEQIEKEMHAAASSLQFERAVHLREKLELLRWLSHRLGYLRAYRAQQSFIYPVPGSDETSIWYLLVRGMIVEAIPEPRNVPERKKAAKIIRAAFQNRGGRESSTALGTMEEFYLVSSWFRRHAGERDKLLSSEDALRQIS